jgi:hypothetical protein
MVNLGVYGMNNAINANNFGLIFFDPIDIIDIYIHYNYQMLHLQYIRDLTRIAVEMDYKNE